MAATTRLSVAARAASRPRCALVTLMLRKPYCKKSATPGVSNRPNRRSVQLKLSIGLYVSIAVSLAGGGNLWAAIPAEFIDITLTQAMREYCHVVRFPQGWRDPAIQRSRSPFV